MHAIGDLSGNCKTNNCTFASIEKLQKILNEKLIDGNYKKSQTSRLNQTVPLIYSYHPLIGLVSELPATASQKGQDGANSLPCLASIFVFIQIVHKEVRPQTGTICLGDEL